MIFYYRKFLKKSAHPNISKKNFNLFCVPEGLKLFYKKKELTKNIGINLSITHNNTRYDCCSYPYNLMNWEKNRLSIEKNIQDISLTIIFDCQFYDRYLKVRLQFSHQHYDFGKLIVMVNQHYREWNKGTKEGVFPKNRSWYDIGESKDDDQLIDSTSIGVQSPHKEFKPLILESKSMKLSFENSDEKAHARLMTGTFSTCESTSFELILNQNQIDYDLHFEQIRKQFVHEKINHHSSDSSSSF